MSDVKVQAHQKVSFTMTAPPYGRVRYTPGVELTGVVTAVLPDHDMCTVLLDEPNRGELLLRLVDVVPSGDGLVQSGDGMATAVARPARCLHQTGELSELVMQSNFWKVNDGRLGQKGSDEDEELYGRWEYHCFDCGKQWNMTKLGKTRLKWLQRLCAQAKEQDHE